MTGAKTERWSGRIGFVLATIGSAIGLGSIWKFPYEVGENGGAGFVLFYIVGLALVVVPLLLAEFLIGRRGRGDAAGSLSRLAAESGVSGRWAWVGWLGIATGFIVLTYYSVIAGMTIAYTVLAVGDGFGGIDGTGAATMFGELVASPVALTAYQAAFMAVTAIVVGRGIGSGVEIACKFLMPLLAFLMVVLVVYALWEGAAGRALSFLFALRMDSLTPRAALEALGLGFFSIGVGLGLMITYAAYAGAEFNLSSAAIVTIVGDTAISLLAGLAIFPLVFVAGLDPAAGPSLMFLTLPIAFGQLPFGDWVGAAFFVLLFIAALASAMSLLELVVSPLLRVTNWPRPRIAVVVAGLCWVGGLPAVLSFNHWADVRPVAFLPALADYGVFDVIDGLASNILLPVGGLLLAIFAGWRLKSALIGDELAWSAKAVRSLRFLLRWVAPALILVSIFAGYVLH